MLVYFRDRLEEKKAERLIFDGMVDLMIELGLVKRKGKQRLDSTHIVGYVKAMSWMECAIETLSLALEDLEREVGQNKHPEFWGRLWEFYVESNLDWQLSKTEQANRHRQCGQDIRELLEWIDRTDPKLAEREAVKLLRRVFGEQFEVVEGKLDLSTQRPSRAVQNPYDPDAHYADRRPSSGLATKYTWPRRSIHKCRSRKRANPPNISLPRCSPPKQLRTRWPV